ncbi:MAG: hypothetical protein OXL97_02160 [Chloroflexota bacterium]|nr:hypothetical protein [Chloroflexota bacterium]MDE2884782.1 hypothetical protein [Chloroflexota bacterium]
MTHISYTKVRLRQTARFYRDGSALAGTIVGGPAGLETSVDVESEEPSERVRRLVDMAEASCYALQSLLQNVEVTSVFTLNGDPLPEAAPA